MSTSIKERNPAMDIIRCFALFCVIAVHFFKYCDFYYKYVIGSRMYIMTLLRSSFLICVPLFLMLSGYLLCKKEISIQYYKKLGNTILTYILASICCYLYKICFVEKNSFSIAKMIARVLAFKASPYAWYINMYIGLFLLIPFLNIIYHNLKSKKEKQLLISVLLLLTSIPHLTSILDYSDMHWWMDLSALSHYQSFLPNWWLDLYPFTYYFLGIYLREYPLKIQPMKNLLYIFLTFLAVGTFTFIRCYNKEFISGPWQENGSILNVIPSVLVFNFLSTADYSRINVKLSSFLAYLSKLCLGAYLVSWIFDDLFYNILLPTVQPTRIYWLNYYPFIVFAIYCCSLLLSALLHWIQNTLCLCLPSIYLHSKSKR